MKSWSVPRKNFNSKSRKGRAVGPKQSYHETIELLKDCKPPAGAIELNSNRMRAIVDVSDSSRYGINGKGDPENFDLSKIMTSYPKSQSL